VSIIFDLTEIDLGDVGPVLEYDVVLMNEMRSFLFSILLFSFARVILIVCEIASPIVSPKD
jgi:hypothetical protein